MGKEEREGKVENVGRPPYEMVQIDDAADGFLSVHVHHEGTRTSSLYQRSEYPSGGNNPAPLGVPSNDPLETLGNLYVSHCTIEAMQGMEPNRLRSGGRRLEQEALTGKAAPVHQGPYSLCASFILEQESIADNSSEWW